MTLQDHIILALAVCLLAQWAMVIIKLVGSEYRRKIDVYIALIPFWWFFYLAGRVIYHSWKEFNDLD